MNKKNAASGPNKIPTGIAGFDHLTGGGLAARRTTLVLGGPGVGKTVFALQALVSGAQRGEPGIFVSFDEHPRQLVENGASFGWDLGGLEKRMLVFLDGRMRPGMLQSGHFDLTGMLAGLHTVATEIGAKRIVLDSLDVMLTLLDDRMAELQETFRIRDWLFEHGFTGILTANIQSTGPEAAQRYAFMQFIADCTVALDCRLAEGVATRYLRVVKYRGSGFQEREFPFVIGPSGVDVLLPRKPGPARSDAIAGLGSQIALARQQLTARIQALDHFLDMKQAELDFLLEQESARVPETLASSAAEPASFPVILRR